MALRTSRSSCIVYAPSLVSASGACHGKFKLRLKIGLKTVGADKAENFSISRNVAGLRVNFISTGKKSQATNKIERTFLQGATLQKYDPSKVEVKKPVESEESPEP